MAATSGLETVVICRDVLACIDGLSMTLAVNSMLYVAPPFIAPFFILALFELKSSKLKSGVFESQMYCNKNKHTNSIKKTKTKHNLQKN